MKKMFLFFFGFLLVISIFVTSASERSDYSRSTSNTNNNSSDKENGNKIQNELSISTQNYEEDSQIKIRTQLRQGTYLNEEGKEVEIQTGNKTRLKVKNIEANSSLNITPEEIGNKTRLRAQLSNGRNAEIKVMPDTASETALARLRIKYCNESNNCSIELKEVGNQNQTKVAYEIRAEKEVKVLGIFRARMKVQSQIDAENGEVVKEKKPWWAFLSVDNQ